jgi:1,4-alpha-glucan branching enzyme
MPVSRHSQTMPKTSQPEWSLLSDDDLHWFNEGTHSRLHDKLGAHPIEIGGKRGTYFAVWAPNAEYVSVIGNFNGWDRGSHALQPRGNSGIWEGFIPDVGPGMVYKYHISSRHNGYRVDKADPFGFMHEMPPKTASVIRPLDYQWNDGDWMRERWKRNGPESPISVYEVHIGSWRRVVEDNYRSLNYRELAHELANYVKEAGFTHVEFLPVMEHPLYRSWGYQTTGYFAPSSRFGAPQDFMYLVDHLHQQGIGIILDWVPSHFPNDEHGLAYFDGTHLFEHSDPRLGFHPDWKSAIFNYGRNEVRAFLLSSAMFWMEKFHADGLRVDAVASMLYLDYSRKEGEWIPNKFGGRENLDAIDFLRQLNSEVYRTFPDSLTIAEESTAWPMVSRPVYVGGLGFGYKWDMGWMHDSLKYLSRDPIHRHYHHNELTFRGIYQFFENYMLPISHDEVVHGKGSLMTRMAGDDWQKFANLRLLLTDQWTQTGKKLLFMGCEIGQREEWNHDASIAWHLLDSHSHRGILNLVRDLNHIYRNQRALHIHDCRPEGFRWLDANDADGSTLSYMRTAGHPEEDAVVVLLNFTPVPRGNYRVGVPAGGFWKELLNTDAGEYGGSGLGNLGGVEAVPIPYHGQPWSLTLTLPPLGALIMKRDPSKSEEQS